MSITEMESKARELQELKRMKEDLEAEITATEDAIKDAMGDREQISAGAFRITWKPVTSTRIDTAALRRDLPEVWTEYGKTTTARRFTIA